MCDHLDIIKCIYSAGHCCEVTAVRIQLLMFQGPGKPSSMLGMLPPSSRCLQNIAKTLLLLITIAQMGRFQKFWRYWKAHAWFQNLWNYLDIIWRNVARGSTAKKLRYIFDFWWLKALGRKAYYQGGGEV